MLQKYIGDRAFYRRVMAIAIPLIIQNAITSFVSLLDNVMIGQVGTLQMSGVSIVNQLLFIFNLCIFGANAGAGIFTAQFHGLGDEKNIRYTVRFKLMACTLLSLVWCVVLFLADNSLIGMYLQGEGSAADAAATLVYGREYLHIMLFGLLPFALCNAYASSLRETGQTVVPMVGSIAALLTNLVLNYVLIFGHFGLPAMGVKGAALATVIARFAELAVVAGWTHLHSRRLPFVRGIYRSLYVPFRLLTSIIRKATPLMCNEVLFATGLALVNQSYSTCGLEVVPALNICSTIAQIAGVAYFATGNSTGIILGQMMGAGESEERIRDSSRKLILLSVASGILFGGFIAALSGVFPTLYNTTDQVRGIATQLILINALMLPSNSYVHAAYFALRSGGKTLITFLFDSGFMWGVFVPSAFFLSRFTSLPIVPLYFICQSVEYIKAVVGWLMLKKCRWIQNLTKN